MGYKWKPSQKARREYAIARTAAEQYADDNGIQLSGDSAYFSVAGQDYRVSNHTVEASNSAAFAWDGTQIRNEYHPQGRERSTTYIHASMTRLPEIHAALVRGKILDGRGYEK